MTFDPQREPEPQFPMSVAAVLLVVALVAIAIVVANR